MTGYVIPLQLQASIALLLSQLSFSGWHILGSVSFHDGADPLVFCMYRIILGTTLMHAYVRYYGMSMVIDPQDYLRFFFLGVLSFLSMILTAFCLTYIAPSRFAIFQPSIPCIVAGLSMLAGLEKLSRLKILGIAVAVAGAVLAEMWKFQAIDSAELDIPLGTGLAIGQVLSMGVLLVGVKPLLNKYQPAVVSCVYFTVATVATILLCLARIDTFPPGAFHFNNQYMPWVALVYAAVFTTLFAFIALSWGSKYLNPSASTAYFTFQPLGTIVLSAIILGSVVTLPEVVGGLMIIAGLGITSTATILGTDDGEQGNTNNSTGNNALVSELPTDSESRSAMVLDASPVGFLRAAYKKSSFLSPPLPKYAYNPLSMDESVDIEMGELIIPVTKKSAGIAGIADIAGIAGIAGIADIEFTESIGSSDTVRSLPGQASIDSYKHTNLSSESTDSPDPPDSVQGYAHNVPIVRVISAHNMKSMHSPVRQRSVTVDSSPSMLNRGTNILLHAHNKNGMLRRNQNSFNT